MVLNVVCIRDQRTTKSKSVWEQRTNQLRRHNIRSSSEALFNELDPEDRLRLTSALHLHPDMKTHLDRPLVMDGRNGDKTSETRSEGHEEAVEGESHTHSRKHHRHHNRNGENRDGGDNKGGTNHGHRSRRRDQNGDGGLGKERKPERRYSRDVGQGHWHHHHRRSGSPEENGETDGGDGGHHRPHYQHPPNKGNGSIGNGERRNDGDNKARCSRMLKAQSTLNGDECKRNRKGVRGHR